jgi:hypothetical protein
VEQREWDNRIREAWEPYRIRIDHARAALDEEIAVLRMMTGGGAVAVAALAVSMAGETVMYDAVTAAVVDNSAELRVSRSALDEAVQRLWRVANGGYFGDQPQ